MAGMPGSWMGGLDGEGLDGFGFGGDGGVGMGENGEQVFTINFDAGEMGIDPE